MRHAVINGSNIVVNVIELVDSTQWMHPEGCTVVPTDTGNINDTYNGMIFIRPPVTLPADPTPDQVLAIALQARSLAKALLLALNDGSLPIGSNLANGQLRAILRAKI
jgi:hypothetical protein